MKANNTINKMTTGAFLVLITVACMLIAVPTVSAQGYGGQQGSGGQGQQGGFGGKGQQQQMNFDDSDLQKYAEAQTKVDEIRSEFSKELEGVNDRAKAQELQDKYSQRMIDSIDETGLGVRKYNEISMALQSNPDLQKKIEKLR